MKLLIALTLTLFSFTSFGQSQMFQNGQVQNAPYNSALKKLIDLQALDGQHVVRLAKATYDVAVKGGASGTNKNLGVFLPANAVVRQSWSYAATAFNAPSGTNLRVSCANAGDVIPSTAFGSFTSGAIVAGTATGAAAAFQKIGTSRCQLYAEALTHDISAGKLNIYVEYFVTQ